MSSWWDDPRFKRVIAGEQESSVTHRGAPVNVTGQGKWYNRCECEMCGKEFLSKRRVQGTKFCSPACRQKHYRQTKKLEL